MELLIVVLVVLLIWDFFRGSPVKKLPDLIEIPATAFFTTSATLTNAEVGVHIRAMCLFMFSAAPLPRDTTRLCSTLNCTPAEWRHVAPFWVETDAGWVHRDLERQRTARDRARASQSDKARKRWHSKPDPVPDEMPRQTPREVPATDPGTVPYPSVRSEDPVPDLDHQTRAPEAPELSTRPVDIAQSLLPSSPDEAADMTSNPRALLALTHAVLDDMDRGEIDPRDVAETVKTRAAQARIAYDAEAVRKALDSAETQREKQTPIQAACRLALRVLEAHGRPMPIDEFNAAIYGAVHATWPAESFAGWRDKVVAWAWREQFWTIYRNAFDVTGRGDERMVRVRPRE